jgi:hypothetical protein
MSRHDRVVVTGFMLVGSAVAFLLAGSLLPIWLIRPIPDVVPSDVNPFGTLWELLLQKARVGGAGYVWHKLTTFHNLAIGLMFLAVGAAVGLVVYSVWPRRTRSAGSGPRLPDA